LSAVNRAGIQSDGKMVVESIQTQCEAVNVAFFFKQWDGVRKDLTGRALNGRIFDAMPLPDERPKTPLFATS